jgi:hypothetical protein
MGSRVFRSRLAPLVPGFVLALSAMRTVHASVARPAVHVTSAAAEAGSQSDVLEEDAAVAADQGLDYSVMLGRSRAQGRLSAVVDALSSEFPESFGGLRLDSGLSLVALFKGRHHNGRHHEQCSQRAIESERGAIEL